MKVLSGARVIFVLSICVALFSTSIVTARSWIPAIKLTTAARLLGSFVSRQVIYADADRIFLCSFQGDLFVLCRDRKTHFSLVQSIHLCSALTAMRGDDRSLYVS